MPIKTCEACKHWQNGEGTINKCYKIVTIKGEQEFKTICKHLNKAADGNKPLREARLADLHILPDAIEQDYKEVLYSQSRNIEMLQRFKKLTGKRRAIVTLHVAGFCYSEISQVLQVSRQYARATVLKIGLTE